MPCSGAEGQIFTLSAQGGYSLILSRRLMGIAHINTHLKTDSIEVSDCENGSILLSCIGCKNNLVPR
jgi:hypothetical protein